MKNKDYVSQPKRQAKKKSANNKPSKAPFPKLKLLIVAGLIGLFAYFLLFLKKGSDPVVEAPSKPSAAVKKDKAEIPPPPDDEEWQFIEELKNKEVQVGTEELEEQGPWYMRCTTVRSKQRAEALKAKIAFAGHESVVKEYQGTSGLWYRVDLGPYDRKREAEKVRHVMKRNNINGCKINKLR
jgi:cell division protein FtsN